MENFAENRAGWHSRVRLVFWSLVTVAVLYPLAIGLNTVNVVGAVLNLFDAVLSAMMDMGPFNPEIDPGPLPTACVAIGVALSAAWITSLVGIYRFRDEQISETARDCVSRIFSASVLEGAPLPVIGVMLLAGAGPGWISLALIAGWIAVIVGYVILYNAAGELSGEESWSRKAVRGARRLKTFSAYGIWLQVFPVIALVTVGFTCMIFVSKLKGLAVSAGSYDPWTGLAALSRTSEIQSDFETTLLVETVISGILMTLLSVMQLIYRLTGWYSIMKGGAVVCGRGSCAGDSAAAASAGFCHRCGTMLPEGSSFCPKCGAQVVSAAVVDAPADRERDNILPEDPVSHTGPSETPDSVSAVPDGYGYEDDRRKKWPRWVAACVFAVAAFIAVWAICFRSDGFTGSGMIFADTVSVYSSPADGSGETASGTLAYGTGVRYRDEAPETRWVEIKAVGSDGHEVRGFIDRSGIMSERDFNLIDKGGLESETVRFWADMPAHRRAIADALAHKGEGWILEVLEDGIGPAALNRIEDYIKELEPNPYCFGFVVRNVSSGKREFMLYSYDENGENPALRYKETVGRGKGKVKSISMRKGKMKVIYADGTANAVNTSDSRAMSGRDYILLQGSIDDRYDIRMEIKIDDDGPVSGTYRYLKNDVPISISGHWTAPTGADKTIQLQEEVNGNITGNFTGSYDGTVYSGIWSSADGEREMRFKVTKTDFM